MAPGMSSVINAEGKLEFVFPVTDNAASSGCRRSN
jgi:hypothetical protein